MKSGRFLGHRMADILLVLLIFSIPLHRAGFPAKLFTNRVDAVTSASVILEKPSGEYIVVINQSFHPDKEKLYAWRDFFEGREIPVLGMVLVTTAILRQAMSKILV